MLKRLCGEIKERWRLARLSRAVLSRAVREGSPEAGFDFIEAMALRGELSPYEFQYICGEPRYREYSRERRRIGSMP